MGFSTTLFKLEYHCPIKVFDTAILISFLSGIPSMSIPFCLASSRTLPYQELKPRLCNFFISLRVCFNMDVSESDWIRFKYIIQFAWIVTLGWMDLHSPKVITFDEVALIPRSVLRYHRWILSTCSLPLDLVPHTAHPYVSTGLTKLSNRYIMSFGDKGPQSFVFFFNDILLPRALLQRYS